MHIEARWHAIVLVLWVGVGEDGVHDATLLKPTRAIYMKVSHNSWIGRNNSRSCPDSPQRRSLCTIGQCHLGIVISDLVRVDGHCVKPPFTALINLSTTYSATLLVCTCVSPDSQHPILDEGTPGASRMEAVGLNEAPSAQHKMRSRTQPELPHVRATAIATHMCRCFQTEPKPNCI